MLKVSDFPTLKDLKGRTLITTDGTTLLGADDKAGVAEIVTALEEIISSGMPHGDIWVGFTRTKKSAAVQIYLTWIILRLLSPIR